jgi:NDP-sugar pyrophosphorylase family protein
MNILIPMAGRGSRFLQEKDTNPLYALPKPLIPIAGHEMVKWALSSLPISPKDSIIFIVLKEHIENAHIDQKLKSLYGEQTKIVVVDSVTEGAACTALLAQEYIDNEEPLIITDSDHYVDGSTVTEFIAKNPDADGVIPVFYANNAKWSFSRTDDTGRVVEVAEKVQLSRNANIGIYYFKHGRDFVWAAEEMIEENDRTNNEFYIAPVYNYLIRRGKKILLSRPRFVHGLGTPKDVEKFLIFLKRGEIETNLPIHVEEHEQLFLEKKDFSIEKQEIEELDQKHMFTL